MPKELDKLRKEVEGVPLGKGLLEQAARKAKLRQKMMDAMSRGDFEGAEKIRKKLQGEK